MPPHGSGRTGNTLLPYTTLEPVDLSLAPRTTVLPYLAVAGADRAIDWYVEVLGAREIGEPIVMGDGRVGHAELAIGGGRLMLSEEHPEIGVVAPSSEEGVPVTIYLDVADVDAVIGRAARAGARLERQPADHEYGRNGVIRDPFGHRWLVSGPATGPRLRHGDIGYVSLWVPDVERAAAFFAAVLGWEYAPGSGPQSRQVEGIGVHHGLWGGVEQSTLFLCVAVEDLRASLGAVGDAGGTAGEPHLEPYGLVANCVDNQGSQFALFEPSVNGGAAAPSGASPDEGTLAYVTMEVVDSELARSFYGSVLGWRFLPGRVEDGWQVAQVEPMTGLSGGHELASVIPMYRVRDIERVVDRVRAAGGTATDPEVQPYGVTATCEDDQGTRFYLGQL